MDANVCRGTGVSAGFSRKDHEAFWHKSAPKAVRKGYRLGEESEGFAAWVKHLARRKEPRSPRMRPPGAGSPLAWGLSPAVLAMGSVGDLVARIDRIDRLEVTHRKGRLAAEQAVLDWLGTPPGPKSEVARALESLALAAALPRLAGGLGAEVWFDLIDDLLGVAGDAAGIARDGAPLVHQLLAGELPLWLAALFPEIAPCRKQARAGRKALSAGLVDLLDGEGLPHARHLGILRPLLACWTRCRRLGDALSSGCWSRSAQVQYEWFIRQSLRLTRRNGTSMFGPTQRFDDDGEASCRELLGAALEQTDDATDHAIAARVVPSSWQIGPLSGNGVLPKEAALRSEWAEVAVLRPDWSAGSPCLGVACLEASMRIELECASGLVGSGEWGFEVVANGEPARPRSDWEEVCWISDDDADYLELEIELSHGLRLQRHLMLGRNDHVLLLADAVLGEEPIELAYRGSFPLVDGAAFEPAEATHEGFLTTGRRAALVMPLGLPEWRADSRPGTLGQDDRSLTLFQSTAGRSLFAPLFFDLKGRRMLRPFTWRHLTVAQDLEICRNDEAVGYRVQVGGSQWLVYRSLTKPGNRTLLGHNLSTELLVARFRRTGEVVPLVEIE